MPIEPSPRFALALVLVLGIGAPTVAAQEMTYRLLEGSAFVDLEGAVDEMTGEFQVELVPNPWPVGHPSRYDHYHNHRMTDFGFEVGGDVWRPYESLVYDGVARAAYPPHRFLTHQFEGWVSMRAYSNAGEIEVVSQEEIEGPMWSYVCRVHKIWCEQVLEPRLFFEGRSEALNPFERGTDAELPPRFHLHGYVQELVARFTVQRYPCGLEASPEIPNPQLCDGLYEYAPHERRYVGTFDLVAARLEPVEIDVQPRDPWNRVWKGRSIIRVGLFGSADLDVADVDVSSLRLGPGAAPPMNRGGATRFRQRDLNDDGLDDLVVPFRTRRTGLQPRDEEVCLTGDLADGSVLEECDAVEILPRHRSRRRR